MAEDPILIPNQYRSLWRDAEARHSDEKRSIVERLLAKAKKDLALAMQARIAGKPAIEALFERFDAALSAAGFLAMSGQIIDASIVAAPKQRNTDGEKRDIKQGRIPPQWPAKPAKLRQKDRDAR